MNKRIRGKTTPFAIKAAREMRSEPTRAEEILWDALRGRKLNGLKFRRQHPFDHFILDMFCVEHQLAIEIDGGGHQEPNQKEYDEARSQFMEEKGIKVLRFTNSEIENNLLEVMKRILMAAGFPSPDGFLRQERGAKRGEEK